MRREIDQVPKTALEVFKMLPEGTLCEVIDNVLYMSPSPSSAHQRILGKIFAAINLEVEKSQSGEVFLAPLDVFLDEERNAVQPDIFFIINAKAEIVRKDGIHGVPDLIIELLYSNRAHDTQLKFSLYQKKEVQEYIIIDPETKQVWQYLLTNGEYTEQDPAQPGKVLISLLQLSIDF